MVQVGLTSAPAPMVVTWQVLLQCVVASMAVNTIVTTSNVVPIQTSTLVMETPTTVGLPATVAMVVWKTTPVSLLRQLTVTSVLPIPTSVPVMIFRFVLTTELDTTGTRV